MGGGYSFCYALNQFGFVNEKPVVNSCCCYVQDDANKMGGKWIIRLRKGLASRCWENLILAMLGEQFMVGEEICGAVVSVRFQVRPTIGNASV